MGTQTNFSSGYGRYDWWARILHGLQQGHLSAYVLLLALAIAATVAYWAGSHLMRKDTGR